MPAVSISFCRFSSTPTPRGSFMPHAKAGIVILLGALCLCSWGAKDERFSKETIPVSGQLVVDGAPVENIAVSCYDVTAAGDEPTTLPQAFTDKDGKFKLST